MPLQKQKSAVTLMMKIGDNNNNDSAASDNDSDDEKLLPTLPNTPQSQRTTNFFQQFFLHLQNGTSTSLSTLSLPIRAFVRVFRDDNDKLQCSAVPFTQADEETFLRDLFFSKSTSEFLASTTNNISHNDKKDKKKSSSTTSIFAAIIRFSDYTSTSLTATATFDQKIWHVDAVSVGNGFISPTFCRDSSSNPFQQPTTGRSKSGTRRNRTSNDENTGSAPSTSTMFSLPLIGSQSKQQHFNNKSYSTLIQHWCPSETPLQFHIVIEEERKEEGSSKSAPSASWNVSALRSIAALGFPSCSFSVGSNHSNNTNSTIPDASAASAAPTQIQPSGLVMPKLLMRSARNSSSTVEPVKLISTQDGIFAKMMQSSDEEPSSKPASRARETSTKQNNNRTDKSKKTIAAKTTTTTKNTTGNSYHGTSASLLDEEEETTLTLSNINTTNNNKSSKNTTVKTETLSPMLPTHDDMSPNNTSIVRVKQTGARKKKIIEDQKDKEETAAAVVEEEKPKIRAPSASVKKSKAITRNEGFASEVASMNKRNQEQEQKKNSSSSSTSNLMNIVTCGVRFTAKQDKWIANFKFTTSSDDDVNDSNNHQGFLAINKNDQVNFPAEFMLVSSDGFDRSIKLMCGLATATNIVTEEWFEDAMDKFSTKKSQIPDLVRKHMLATVGDFTVKRKEVARFNKENECCDIETFVRRIPVVKRTTLLKEKIFFVEDKVEPQSNNNDVKDVIRAFGGNITKTKKDANVILVAANSNVTVRNSSSSSSASPRGSRSSVGGGLMNPKKINVDGLFKKILRLEEEDI